MILFYFLLFSLYLVIGRVIVLALVKRGYIGKYTFEFFCFTTYLFLPLTLFIIGVTVASDGIAKHFNLK
jgi:hypothetical protein